MDIPHPLFRLKNPLEAPPFKHGWWNEKLVGYGQRALFF